MGDLVKRYFALGLYEIDDLRIFVQAAYITIVDFKQLTGQDYAA